MAEIDRGLLPHLRRKIYGPPPTPRKRSRRVDPGYEPDAEDNRSPLRGSSSPSRPDPILIALGAHTVSRNDDDGQVMQRVGKRKRKSHGDSHVKINTDSDEPAPTSRHRRRSGPRKRRRNTSGAACNVDHHADTIAEQESMIGYLADDEKGRYQSEKVRAAPVQMELRDRGRGEVYGHGSYPRVRRQRGVGREGADVRSEADAETVSALRGSMRMNRSADAKVREIWVIQMRSKDLPFRNRARR